MEVTEVSVTFRDRLNCCSLVALALSVLIFQSAHAQPKTLEEAEANILKMQTPPGYELLAHGRPACGEGDLYFVQKGRFGPEKLNWARQSFGFIYYYEDGLNYNAILEYGTNHRVTKEQAETLLSAPDYLAWLGEQGRSLMMRLHETRNAYLVHAPDLDASINRLGIKGFDQLPEVAAYRGARRAARAWLVRKMNLQIRSDMTSC